MSSSDSAELVRIIQAGAKAEDELAVRLKDEFDQFAHVILTSMPGLRDKSLLDTTGLTSEAWMKIVRAVRQDRDRPFQSSDEIMSFARTAMRRLLIDLANQASVGPRDPKTGFRVPPIPLSEDFDAEDPFVDKVPVHDWAKFRERLSVWALALEESPRQIFVLRYFGDLSYAKISSLTGTPERTVSRNYNAVCAEFRDRYKQEFDV